MKRAAHLQSSRLFKHTAFAGAASLLLLSAGARAQDIKDDFAEFEQKELITTNQGSYSFSTLPSVINATGAYRLGFEAVTQYDAAGFARNFIPPDTMGAVGTTQFMAVSNGAYGVFDKTTGARLSVVADTTFWAAAGQTGANGDSRVLFNSTLNRWVVTSFGASTSDLQIAVSDTADATGTWKSIKYTAYAGLGFGGTADYPTLAMDKNAIYIGTNNFAPATSGGANNYRGTTLNVIPVNSVFAAGGPTITNMSQIVTPYVSGGSSNVDNGFAIQGVNSKTAGTSGKFVAASAFVDDYVAYKVNGVSSSSAVGATQTASVVLGTAANTAPGAARQPSVALAANQRIIDASDGRVSSSAYEVNGRIYMVATIQDASGGDFARVRWTVLDSNTFAILAQGDIGSGAYDYYMGSIAVNDSGQVVIGYDRSGLDPATGKVALYAQSFSTAANGSLTPMSGETFLHDSLTDDYHNGSIDHQAASGRQRWGDYSQVTVDPTDQTQFYVIGEFAREYNDAENGHVGGTGGSRWGTWVAVMAVPEPATYLMMLMGVSGIAAFARRKRRAAV